MNPLEPTGTGWNRGQAADGYTVPCAICGEPVDPDGRSTWRRVEGWEHKAGVRASGKHGGSDITLRKLRDEWAHGACVAKLRSGVNARQETLLA